MLKSVLFYLLIAFTGIRFVDMIYLLSSSPVNLPVAVIAVTTAMVLYGTALMVKRFIVGIRMKELMAFYLVQAAAIVFNLGYVSFVCPLQLSFAEIIAVGTFLDLVVDGCVVYYCLKQMRRPMISMIPVSQEGKLHV